MVQLVALGLSMSVDVRFPDMRNQLKSVLNGLRDFRYQEEVWVGKRYPRENFFDDLSETYEILEDLGVLDNPRSRVGSVLKSEGEADAMEQVAGALSELFARYGYRLSDDQYLGKPEWAAVIAAAGHAYDVILESDS
ncbi:SCO4402 family protein [Fodinicola feengrottensis]|uniref:Uncharacterized protein n=1 Tax=Fodinicola feengrottensis TaxID=435914 RepID=A0ABN2HTZ0_9ACTN|nr:hypothetical protein [Fodinicola feengrottensis]